MKKNLFITLMLVLLALPLASCGNDDEPVVTPPDDVDVGELLDVDNLLGNHIDNLIENVKTYEQGTDKVYSAKVFGIVNENTTYSCAYITTEKMGGYEHPGPGDVIFFRVSGRALKEYGTYTMRIKKYFPFYLPGLNIPEEVQYYCVVEFLNQ